MIEILECRLGKTLYLATLEKSNIHTAFYRCAYCTNDIFLGPHRNFSKCKFYHKRIQSWFQIKNIVLWCRVVLKEYPGLKRNVLWGPKKWSLNCYKFSQVFPAHQPPLRFPLCAIYGTVKHRKTPQRCLYI